MRWLKCNLQIESNSLRLLVWVVFVLAATLFPFDFEVQRGGRWVLDLRDAFVLDVALNILLFLPCGVLLAQRCRSGALGFGLTNLLVGASALAFSCSIEFFQQFLASRSSSVVDVLSNTTGATIGFHAYKTWGRRIAAHWETVRLNAPPALRVGALVGCSIVVLFISGILQYCARLSNWDDTFHLLIGNEYTGDRPWQGTVFRIDLSDRAASEELVYEFAAGDSRRLQSGNIVALDFTTDALPQHVAANLPVFVWVGSANIPTSGGVKFNQDAWLQTAQPARETTRRIRASNEFTLRVLCTSDSADQSGPARIFSHSIDTLRRNFTLGQEGPDLVFRLRTPSAGPNGTRIPLVFPGVFASRAVRDILITYRGATLRVAIAGTRNVHSLAFGPGVNLVSLYLQLQPRDFPYITLLYCGLAFLLQLGLLAWCTKNTGHYLTIGLFWVPTVAFALEATLAFAAPRPFDWGNLSMSLVVGSVLLIVFAIRLGKSAIPGPGAFRSQAV